MPNHYSFSIVSKSVLLIGYILSLSGCITLNAKSLDYKETKILKLDTPKIEWLKINATAGFIIITGDNNLDHIEVIADIETYNQDFKLSLEVKGSDAILEADTDENSFLSWGNYSPKIDLTIKLPPNLKLSIKDGSGQIQIVQMKNDILIDDGSGDMTISDISGNLEIEDGSGNIMIKNIGGNVSIEDGSGDMSISDTSGNLEIVDGSGSTMIKNITANVSIKDGSGDLTIDHVDGKVFVDDGSGDIKISSIGGLVTITDGSGDVNLKKLRGGLIINDDGSGSLSMSEIEGSVTLK